jgi:hypothetical protein
MGVGTPAGGAADGAAEVPTQRLAVSGLKSRNTNMGDTAEHTGRSELHGAAPVLAVSHSGRSAGRFEQHEAAPELHGAAPGMMGMVGG